MVAPIEIAAWTPCWLTCSRSRASACWARRSRSSSATRLGAYFLRRALHALVALGAGRLAEADPEVALALARARERARGGVAEELEPLLPVEPRREVPAPALVALGLAGRRGERRPVPRGASGAVSRSATATSMGLAPSQLTGTAASVIGVATTTSSLRSTPAFASAKRTVAAPRSMG